MSQVFDFLAYGEPETIDAVAASVAALQAHAAEAGVTSASFPSRRPIGSVLDDLSARPEKAKGLGVSRVRTLLAHAEHFLLDEEAGQRVIDMVTNHGQLLNDLNEFALRPYERMTISMPSRAKGDAERETLILLDQYQDINAFALVLRDTRTGELAPIPGWYASPRAKVGDPGRTVVRLDDAMPDDQMMKYSAATYSMAIDAILLMLNQKRGVHVSEPTARRRSLRSGRPVTLFSRSTIHLSLDSPEELRLSYAGGGTHASPRRHAVRGHFFHLGGSKTCTHRWARIDGFDNGWECVDCDRRRFWRNDFERGDAERGYIASRYKVGTGGEA